jgi:hypothetical protein
MANLFDELNATTMRVIRPKIIADLAFYKSSPFLAYLRAQALPHSGGAAIQNTFLYNKTVGGPYSKGDTFDLTRQQLIDGTVFDMRYYEQNDTQYLEDIDVENRGEAKVFDIVTLHQEDLMMTMNENLAIEMYRHGQNATLDNRQTSVNGLAEQLNDGVNNSWEGNVFTTYGGQTRNGTIGTALNSIPYFFGDNVTGAAGPITYSQCLEQYLAAKGGNWVPTIAVGNKAVFAYVLERLQPQQRYTGGGEWIWGGDSWNLMGMRFMEDQYCPSARFGINDPRTGNFLTSTFTSASTVTSDSNLPTSTTVTVGETFWMLNPKTFQMHLSDSERFRFGWTGYKEVQNSTVVAGQLLVALNVLNQFPRASKQCYGINS